MSAEKEMLAYTKRERNIALARAKSAISEMRSLLTLVETQLDNGADNLPWRNDDASITASDVSGLIEWTGRSAALIDQYATMRMIAGSVRDEEIKDTTQRLQPGQRFFFNTQDGVMIGGVYRDAMGSWHGYDEDATIGFKDGDIALKFIIEELIPGPENESIVYGVEEYR